MNRRMIQRVVAFALVVGLAAHGFAAPEQEPPREREAEHPEHPDRPHERRVTFLGVATVPVPEELRDHLEVAPGTGLMIAFVEHESPAARAGLVKNDILVKLGDQLLVNHDQLSTLIHGAEPGEEVTLDVIHAGQRKPVAVKLGDRIVEEPPFRIHREWRPGPEREWHGERPAPPEFDFRRQIERIERQLRESGLNDEQVDRTLDHLREQMHRMHEWSREHPRPPHEFESDHPREDERVPEGQTHTSMTYSDDDHRLTLTIEDDHRHLHAETRDGEELFDGPINTPEQREQVPPPLREKLERLERQTHIDIRIAPRPREEERSESRPERDRPPL